MLFSLLGGGEGHTFFELFLLRSDGGGIEGGTCEGNLLLSREYAEVFYNA